MRYLLARIHSWWWHLTYGMWKGYRETRSWSVATPGQHSRIVSLTSTDGGWRTVKVFWAAPGSWAARKASSDAASRLSQPEEK